LRHGMSGRRGSRPDAASSRAMSLSPARLARTRAGIFCRDRNVSINESERVVVLATGNLSDSRAAPVPDRVRIEAERFLRSSIHDRPRGFASRQPGSRPASRASPGAATISRFSAGMSTPHELTGWPLFLPAAASHGPPVL
jgi:hypothetical protein